MSAIEILAGYPVKLFLTGESAPIDSPSIRRPGVKSTLIGCAGSHENRSKGIAAKGSGPELKRAGKEEASFQGRKLWKTKARKRLYGPEFWTGPRRISLWRSGIKLLGYTLISGLAFAMRRPMHSPVSWPLEPAECEAFWALARDD